MNTGIEEIDELTQRAVHWLPQVDSWAGPFTVIEFIALLDNPIFDAVYRAVIVYGDLGMYRLGPVRAELKPRGDFLFEQNKSIH